MKLSSKLLQASAAWLGLVCQADTTFPILKLGLSFLLTLSCAGCVLTYSVSSHEEYRPYIGQTVTLTRPMLLVECHSAVFSTYGVKTLGYARYALTEQERAWGPGPIFAKLSKGYQATIDSVHEEITGDNAVPVVYGHIINPTNRERASFAYVYYSQPLPWQLSVSNH